MSQRKDNLGGPIRRMPEERDSPYQRPKTDKKRNFDAKIKIEIEEDNNTKTQNNKPPLTNKEMQDERKRRIANQTEIEEILKFYIKAEPSVVRTTSLFEVTNVLRSTIIKEDKTDKQNKGAQTNKGSKKECDNDCVESTNKRKECATVEDMEDIHIKYGRYI